MAGNMNNRPVGKCSQCGGVVSLPIIWMSVNRPVPRCESCGAVADETDGLPVIPTHPVRPRTEGRSYFRKEEASPRRIVDSDADWSYRYDRDNGPSLCVR